MTATDQPTPRVGDTITTAEQLDALPDGALIGIPDSEDEPSWWHSPDGMVWLGSDGSEQTSAWLVSDGQAFTVLHRPDAPHPAPVDGDAVERAHRAWDEYPDYNPGQDERDAWTHERDRMAAALAAARAGEAVYAVTEWRHARFFEPHPASPGSVRLRPSGAHGVDAMSTTCESCGEVLIPRTFAARGDAVPSVTAGQRNAAAQVLLTAHANPPGRGYHVTAWAMDATDAVFRAAGIKVRP